MTILRDIFEDIVNATKLKTYNGKVVTSSKDVSFKFGYWMTVSNELLHEGNSKSLQNTRYPCIFLHANITKRIDEKKHVIGTNPTFYILDQVSNKYTVESQLTNIFKPILYPIYEEFIRQIRKSKAIEKTIDLYREKKDLFYMQDISPDQNKIKDYICAIEVKFNDLKIYNNPLL